MTTLATGGLWPIAALAQVDPYARNPVQLGVDVPLTGKGPQGFDASAAACIRNHPWPGNLRELRNAVERAVILARGDRIAAADFPEEMRDAIPPHKAAAPAPADARIGATMSLDQLEEAHIRAILARAGSLTDAASILGIDQATLYRKRKKFGME